jgi:hypothetical protein
MPMGADKKAKAIQRSVSISLYLWLIVTTLRVAPYNPPQWADGVLYIIWCGMLFWVIMIIAMTPVCLFFLVLYKLFDLPVAIFLSSCFVCLFDYEMTKYYPMFAITPGVVLSLLYFFLVLKRNGKIVV